jgi:hypothetical protein
MQLSFTDLNKMMWKTNEVNLDGENCFEENWECEESTYTLPDGSELTLERERF